MPIPVPTLTESDRKRFHAKVAVGHPDDCWEWTAALDTTHRGLFKINHRLYKASRIAYFLATGVDPGGLYVCHTCDNPPCCNPGHLWLGTARQNANDRDRKGRHAARLGEEHSMAILTEEQASYILKSSEQGRALARKFGVHETTISAIRHRRLWKHLAR